MNPTAYGRSLIRTIVPIAVGALVGWLATRGITVDASVIIPAVDGIAAALYYAGVRALEQRWPRLGWLLGSPGAPSYGPQGPPPGIVLGDAPEAPSGI